MVSHLIPRTLLYIENKMKLYCLNHTTGKNSAAKLCQILGYNHVIVSVCALHLLFQG